VSVAKNLTANNCYEREPLEILADVRGEPSHLSAGDGKVVVVLRQV